MRALRKPVIRPKGRARPRMPAGDAMSSLPDPDGTGQKFSECKRNVKRRSYWVIGDGSKAGMMRAARRSTRVELPLDGGAAMV